MARLTDPAQGYCEIYCKKYGHCFCDPGDCIFKGELAMYEALKSIEGIVPFDRLRELARAEQEGRLVVLPDVGAAWCLDAEVFEQVKGDLLWLSGPLGGLSGYKRRMCQNALEIIKTAEAALKGGEA